MTDKTGLFARRLVFLLCITIITTTIFFSIQVPFKQNDRLLREMRSFTKEKEFSTLTYTMLFTCFTLGSPLIFFFFFFTIDCLFFSVQFLEKKQFVLPLFWLDLIILIQHWLLTPNHFVLDSLSYNKAQW